MRKSFMLLIIAIVLLLASVIVFFSTMEEGTSKCKPCGDGIQEYWDAFRMPRMCEDICAYERLPEGDITYPLRRSNESFIILAWCGSALLLFAGITYLWEKYRA